MIDSPRLLASRYREVRMRTRGLTLIEMLAVMVIMGILIAIGFPPLRQVVEKAKITKAIGDLKAIQTDLMAIEAGEQPLPADLNAVGRGALLDPWGQPYVYYPFPVPVRNVPAGARRDRFPVPVNSTFDLYSLGPDGNSSPPFSASKSQDDVVRANDGGYLGLASKY